MYGRDYWLVAASSSCTCSGCDRALLYGLLQLMHTCLRNASRSIIHVWHASADSFREVSGAFITWHRQCQRAKHEHAQIGTAVLATRKPVAPLGGPRARAAASTRYDNVVAAPTPVISSPKQKQHVEALSYQVPPQPSPQTPPSSRSSRMPLPSSSQRVPPSSPSPRISSSSSITPAQHAAQLSTNQPPLLRSDDRRLVSKEELWRKLVLGKALRRWEHTTKERAWEHNAFALASLRMRQRFLQIGFETLRKVGYAEEHEMALRSLVHFRFTRFRQAGLSRSLLRWVQNTLEKSEMVQRTRALVQQHLTNKYTRLAWQEWLAVYQTTRVSCMFRASIEASIMFSVLSNDGKKVAATATCAKRQQNSSP